MNRSCPMHRTVSRRPLRRRSTSILATVAEHGEQYSADRLLELRHRIAGASAMLGEQPLSVYVTGSYGRLEAWAESDIDLFFLHGGSDDEGPFPYTTFIRIAAALIDSTQAMQFPAFTGDGEYLEVHYVGEMERVLGGREDDYVNAFTARMLLLLESRPLLNDEVYESLLARIIGFYFRDYEDHQADFLPIFLQNDILRFWRTLTLNYEHHRLKLLPLSGPELANKKADSGVKNFKLKFSRLSTCFSMVAHLSSAEPPVTPEQVRELCGLTPTDRFRALRGRSDTMDGLLDDLEDQYAEFLEITQQAETDLQAHFGDSSRRRSALGQANRYGATIYKLLSEITPADRLRYLVI